MSEQTNYWFDEQSGRQIPLNTFTLQLFGPRSSWAVNASIPALLKEAEENLTDLLPEGYSVRIREWDAEEETPDE